jgi:hypothetical protein
VAATPSQSGGDREGMRRNGVWSWRPGGVCRQRVRRGARAEEKEAEKRGAPPGWASPGSCGSLLFFSFFSGFFFFS